MASNLLAKCAAPPDHPFFALFDRFYQAHNQLQQDRTIQVLTDARLFLRTELAGRKLAQGWLGHDDLLVRLADALAVRADGDGAAAEDSRVARRLLLLLEDPGATVADLVGVIEPLAEDCDVVLQATTAP